MIAIQFGVYEVLKSKFLHKNKEQRILAAQLLKKRTLKRVSIVRTSAVAMARTARRTSANVSLRVQGKVLDIRTRRRLNRDQIVELGTPEQERLDEEFPHRD
jgi:hypothetical protein